VDRIADRFFRDQHETLLDAHPRASVALKQLALKGYLEARPVVLPAIDMMATGKPSRVVADQYFTLLYCLTPRASRHFNVPLPPNLRENFVQHHLRTLDAIVTVEKHYFWSTDARVVDFKMESQLVREAFAGHTFGGPAYHPRTEEARGKFPDAIVTIQTQAGEREDVRIEYVTRNYTDKMLAEKAAAWTTGRTVWACSEASTARRIEAITGERPLLLSRSSP
jgi:hypothetical protein